MNTEGMTPSQDKGETTNIIRGLESQTVPALQQFGTGRCPVCDREVAIYLAKTRRPFLNCGFCSVRIFYNGRESIKRLLLEMSPVTPKSDDVTTQPKEEEIL